MATANIKNMDVLEESEEDGFILVEEMANEAETSQVATDVNTHVLETAQKSLNMNDENTGIESVDDLDKFCDDVSATLKDLTIRMLFLAIKFEKSSQSQSQSQSGNTKRLAEKTEQIRKFYHRMKQLKEIVEKHSK